MRERMLEDDVVVLRAPEKADIDIMFLWENDTRQWGNGCAVAPYSRQQLWEYVECYEADIFKSRQLKFIIEDKTNGAKVGTIDLFDFDPINSHAFIGLYIDENHRGNGYATRAVEALREYCRDYIGINQLICFIAEDNDECLRIFEKMEFVTSGKLTAWIKSADGYKDAVIMQSVLK